jgi:ADP-heptose:LPS heptosyltransferase
MSLPLAFKTTVDSIPHSTPYLYVNETLREMWEKKLGKKNRTRIGIAWSGSPTHVNDKNRSLPLKSLDALLQLPADFHCLQNQVREHDIEDANKYQNLFMHTDDLKNFMLTAALMKEMDLIISVDTAVAHLAGAIHQPIIILLPFMPDYRWMLDREDSPWYPSASLYRQPAINDWVTPIQNIKQKIEELIRHAK